MSSCETINSSPESRRRRQFSGEEMKELALAYRRAVEERKITLYEDPWAQLQVAIQQVLGSWDSTKAKQYREIMDISDSWGTAVILQAMVFGNLGLSSGSGVVFTAHPYRKIRRVALWGDFTPGNQGEDIVGGLVSTYPISREQNEMDGREGDLPGGRFSRELQTTLFDLQEPGLREEMEPSGNRIYLRQPRGNGFLYSADPGYGLHQEGTV